MRTNVLRIAGLLGILAGLLPVSARGQVLNFDRLEPGQNRIALTAGLDPAVLAAVGYSRTVSLGTRSLALSVELAAPVAAFDAQDYRVVFGAQTWAFRRGSLYLAGRGGVISRGTSNDIFVAHGFGADITAYAGFYARGGFCALEIGFDKEMVTHISHQDWYRNVVYADAVDGWYSAGGGIWHGGVVGGTGLGRFEISLRAVLLLSEGGSRLDPPIEGAATVAYVF